MKKTLTLLQHQQEAVAALKRDEVLGLPMVLIMHTGAGKTYPVLQIALDNPSASFVYLAPTNYINDQVMTRVAEYLPDDADFTARTYASLLSQSPAQMAEESADYIIVDESHRIAENAYSPSDDFGDEIEQVDNAVLEKEHKTWAEKTTQYLNTHPAAKIIYLTATPVRSDGISVINERCGGHISYELRLVEGIARDIVRVRYKTARYVYAPDIEEIWDAVESEANPSVKNSLMNDYKKLARYVMEAEGYDDIIREDIQPGSRWLVFCPIGSDMVEIMADYRSILGEDIQTFSVSSAYSKQRNAREIAEFSKEEAHTTKIIFAKNLLNEGVHIPRLNGVVLGRVTDSRVLYEQQIGRALTTDKSGEIPIVRDLVGNGIRNNIFREVAELRKEYIGRSGQGFLSDFFEVEGEDYWQGFSIEPMDIDFLNMLNGMRDKVSSASVLKNVEKALEFCEENSKKPKGRKLSSRSVISDADKYEHRLAVGLDSARKSVVKRYGSLTPPAHQVEGDETWRQIADIVRHIEIEYSPWMQIVKDLEAYCVEYKTLPRPTKETLKTPRMIEAGRLAKKLHGLKLLLDNSHDDEILREVKRRYDSIVLRYSVKPEVKRAENTQQKNPAKPENNSTSYKQPTELEILLAFVQTAKHLPGVGAEAKKAAEKGNDDELKAGRIFATLNKRIKNKGLGEVPPDEITNEKDRELVVTMRGILETYPDSETAKWMRSTLKALRKKGIGHLPLDQISNTKDLRLAAKLHELDKKYPVFLKGADRSPTNKPAKDYYNSTLRGLPRKKRKPSK